MRELFSHVVNAANEQLTITVQDDPGSGGAHHFYVIKGFDLNANPSLAATLDDLRDTLAPADLAAFQKSVSDGTCIVFQNGPIKVAGANGITHEALLAILIDRLECFQAGPFASTYNAEALFSLKNAQRSLHARTLERMNRGVEGTHTV